MSSLIASVMMLNTTNGWRDSVEFDRQALIEKLRKELDESFLIDPPVGKEYLTPREGDMCYNTLTKSYFRYNGTSWVRTTEDELNKDDDEAAYNRAMKGI